MTRLATTGCCDTGYRGTDRDHPDNRGLRTAMEHRLPLIYFHVVARGRYVAAWPVFVVHDDPGGLFFSVAVDDSSHMGFPLRDRARPVAMDGQSEIARRA